MFHDSQRSEVGSPAEPDRDGGAQWVPDHVAGTTGARPPGAVLHHQVQN